MAPGRRQYDLARHHAWGGLAFLALVAVLRGLLPGLPAVIVTPLLAALAAYVAFWLVLTYRYRSALDREARGESDAVELSKARAKLEKKRAKAEGKARKKDGREPED